MELVASGKRSELRRATEQGRMPPAPFSERVEGLVRRFCDNRYLVASHRVNESTAFHDSLGSNKNEVDHVHAVCHSRIQNDGTWDTSRSELFSGLDTVKDYHIRLWEGISR